MQHLAPTSLDRLVQPDSSLKALQKGTERAKKCLLTGRKAKVYLFITKTSCNSHAWTPFVQERSAKNKIFQSQSINFQVAWFPSQKFLFFVMRKRHAHIADGMKYHSNWYRNRIMGYCRKNKCHNDDIITITTTWSPKNCARAWELHSQPGGESLQRSPWQDRKSVV